MNRKLKHGMSMAVAVLSALFVSTACTDDWDDHYDDNGTNVGKTSLLDYIKNDVELEDFYEVVNSLGCADSLLNQSRVYTLWAPVDGSFDKEAWLEEVRNGNRDKVLTRFVESHMANYLNAAGDSMTEDNFILMLNDKMVVFAGNHGDGYTFDGKIVSDKNIRVGNGIIHKINGYADYAFNIWEHLETAANVDSLKNFLYSFDIREFSPYQSIEGPMVNGEQTYIDSVFINSNQWFFTYGDKYTSGIGQMEAEDSSYVIFAPSNRVWEEMVPKIETYYNFYRNEAIYSNETFDSLQHFYARKALCNYILFSNNDQNDINPDSMLSTYKPTPRLFAKADLMDGADAGTELSNGTFYVKDKFNYSSHYIWHDTIKIEAENSYYQGNSKNSQQFVGSGNGYTYYAGDSEINDYIDGTISNSLYVEAVGLSSAANPSLLWTVPEVLSASYYLRVVFVPAHITSSTVDPSTLLPNKVVMTVKTTNSAGKYTKLAESDDLIISATEIDSVYLPDPDDPTKPMKITFPYSEYGLQASLMNTTIQVSSNVGRRETEYSRRFRVDCVILEPVKEDAENEGE